MRAKYTSCTQRVQLFGKPGPRVGGGAEPLKTWPGAFVGNLSYGTKCKGKTICFMLLYHWTIQLQQIWLREIASGAIMGYLGWLGASNQKSQQQGHGIE